MLSYSERRLKLLLDQILPNEPYKDNYRPHWLKNPATSQNLELDRYYPQLKLGIEFNGSQHRLRNNPAQWERDNLKRKLCGKHGVIRLVFYWKELSSEIVREKIEMSFEMRRAWSNGKSYKSARSYVLL